MKIQPRQDRSTRRIGGGANKRDYWLECAARGLSDEDLVKSALQQLSVNPDDDICHGIIMEAINSHDTRELLHPEPFRRSNPSGQVMHGEIRLGVIRHTSVVWGISPETLTTHLLLVGRTGGGKTTVIKSIIRQCLGKRTP